VFPLLGRRREEPQHQRGDKLRIIGDRDVAQTGQPSQLRMLDEGEESRALHADQRVGGPLQEKDRAGDALKPRRDIEHGRPHGLQVPRRLGEVQQQLTSIIGRQLPGRLRSMAKNSDRPAPVAATGVAMGASSLATVRRLSRAAAW
jgi:hypothetical protein